MHQPPGFSDPNFPNHVCQLKKSLYGLRQAPRAWFDKLFQALKSLGFTQSSSDASLFVLKVPVLVIVLVYVDDILVSGPDLSVCNLFIKKLSSLFPVKDLGPLHIYMQKLPFNLPYIYADETGNCIGANDYIATFETKSSIFKSHSKQEYAE
ncbi:hypothetical protein L3X38_015939 [Prunus dulcis]|uniref:Reverse transcriptase Ty1/copia-type domain-containing protein n=1 Tax=Prunus dulcis TaxID=3755 RepID=A0AAD4W512_PRUDU|nr:hypothetical protein L3X38_015939 [Prunus dulcis]